MTESAELLRVLRRIRRRGRCLGALEAAFAGATLALVALAVAGIVWRARGGPVSWRLVAGATGVATALGAALGGARPVPLPRCARLLDAALDRGGAARDRVLSALWFATSGDAPLAERADAPLARAALHDALSRVRSLAPALIAPARRPRALPALGVATLTLVAVGAWPARAPGARRVGAPSHAAAPADPSVRVPSEALEAERAEVIAASAAAEAAGDVSLTALAHEARATLDALSDGTLGRGEGLERLTALAVRAKEAADEAEAARAAARVAGQALDPAAATRALGHALGGADAEATERALAALASRAEDGAGARAGIASALGAAAAGVGRAATGDDAAASGAADGRRRLDREHEPTSAGGADDSGRADASARRLERLRRDLEDTAAACRGDAEACAKRLRDSALSPTARQAQEAEARRRLETAVRQTRERLRRGDLEGGARGAPERRFARVAEGGEAGEERAGQREGRAGEGRPGAHGAERGAPGGEAAGAGPGDEPGAMSADEPGAGDGADVFADDTAGAESPGAGAAAADGEGTARSGDGAGKESGGEPLGRGAQTPPARGQEREVRVRSGAGPTRSEVIAASARRGFAARDYVRVFDDYQPVVEESLASGAVPEGRRYVVRRYFQLIRPRASAAASRTP